MTQAYPLAWPAGWPRAKTRETSRFKTSLAAALKGLHDELRWLGAAQVVISSNVTLGNNSPVDPGVAAYFSLYGDGLCIPCDRWRTVDDNLQAIRLSVEAMRGLERWGTGRMVKAAFAGFQALPAPTPRPNWREVLTVNGTPPADLGEAEANYRHLAKRCHPDAGGTDGLMTELNAARDAARRELAPNG